jgi:hypothetical protein
MKQLTFAAAALLALAVLTGPADAATQGTWSLGANFGTATYSNTDLNDAIAPVEELSSGWEFGGSLRYQVSPRLALDLEVNQMKPASTTEDPGNPDLEVSTPAFAIPVNAVYELSRNEKTAFNLFGGAGMVTGAKFHAEQGGISDETDAASSFYGQAGLEAQWMMSQQFSLGARAMGRMAKAEIEDEVTPVDADYSGIGFGIGARMNFGGTGE